MNVHELSREQLTQLKEHYYNDRHPEGVSYGELADIDELVSDDEVFTEYEDTIFVPDDFFTTDENYCQVPVLTAEERAEIERRAEEHQKLYEWAWKLDKNQINVLCDMGYYNDTMKGYLIAACKIARDLDPDNEDNKINLTDGQIRTLLQGMRWALDEKTKEEADEFYRKF
jgi:hypothetical protein